MSINEKSLTDPIRDVNRSGVGSDPKVPNPVSAFSTSRARTDVSIILQKKKERKTDVSIEYDPIPLRTQLDLKSI